MRCLICGLLAVLVALGSAATLAADAPILRIEAGGHTDIVRWLGFTPDGRYLLSAGDDKAVRVWDVAEPAQPVLARTIRLQIGAGSAGRISAAALAPGADGRGGILAVGGVGVPDSPEHWGDITLVDFASGDVLGQLRGHTEPIASLAFSPDGRLLASGSGDNTVRVWTVRDGASRGAWAEGVQREGAILRGHTGPVYGLCFVTGQRAHDLRLVTASDDRTLRVWQQDDRGTWATVHSLAGHGREVSRVAGSPTGDWIASASFDRTVRTWNPATGTLTGTLAETAGSLTALAVAPDGRHLVAGGARPFECAVWRVSNGEQTAVFSGHDNTVQWAAYRPDGKVVATTGGNAHEIFLWDPTSGRELSRIVGTGRGVYAVAFAPDGRTVALGNQNQGKHLQGLNSLEHTFDLRHVAPSAAPDEAAEWQRALLGHDGLAANVDGDTVRVEDAGRVLATITLPQSDDRVRCYSFCTLAGRPHIVVGSVYGLALYEAATGRHVRDYVGHTGEIWSVAVSPDHRMLISGSGDQTFRLWNLQTGELLTSVFVGVDRQWVAWTPAGYYKASSGGDKLIGWQVNRGPEQPAEFFAAWQYQERFSQPEVLIEILETLDVQQAVANVNETAVLPVAPPFSLSHELIDSPPPLVTILEPADGSRTREPRIPLRAAIAARDGQPIEEVFVRVNGRPLPQHVGRKMVRENPRLELVLDCLVDLPVGEHDLSVFARTARNTSSPVSVRITREGAVAEFLRPTIYILSVGVSGYQDVRLNLNYADRDAVEVVEAWKVGSAGLFTWKEAKVLVNAEATRAAVIQGLEWLADSVTQHDLAFVFVAGHGVRDRRGKYFFVPHDFDRQQVSSTGVPWSTFQDVLTSLPCKVILAMDTCHSGPLRGDERSREVELDDEIRDLTRVPGGVIVMTSSTGRERSWEKAAWRHGAFALALIEGLTSTRRFQGQSNNPLPADYNGDGLVYLDELDVYISNRVKELTSGAQHPTTDRSGVSFPVARVK